MRRRPLLLTLLLLPAAAACVPAERRASWRVYPLPRHGQHDGLAVVNRPAGAGLHIYLATDTGRPGVCRPRWNPDAARLAGGNGPRPTSSGLAPRAEFFEAMERGRVRWALRRQMEALCRERAPRSRFVWVEPPRRAGEFRDPVLPMLEERDLLSNPKAVLRAEKQLLGLPILPEDYRDEEPPPPADGP